MRWLALIFFLLCSCTAYKNNVDSNEITREELENIKSGDKLLLVLNEEVDGKNYLRGRFKSFTDENILITIKKNGVKESSISLSNIKKIKFDENVPLTVLKVGLGIGGTVFVVALVSFLMNPNIGISGI